MSDTPNPNVFFRGEDMGIGNFPIKGGKISNQPINNGGYAFPMPSGPQPRVDCSTHYNEGMTLRDYFAGQAMAAIITSVYCTPETIYTEVSSRAYAQADAMLKAREAK